MSNTPPTTEAPAAALYDLIEQARVRKGWNKSQVGRESGVDRDTIAAWQTQLRTPMPGKVVAVADVLGIPREQALRAASILPPDPQIDALEDEAKEIAKFAHRYAALLRRHRSAAQYRVESIRDAVDRIEHDLKEGRAPAYQAGAIATDVIHLGERLAALEALSEFSELFAGSGDGQ